MQPDNPPVVIAGTGAMACLFAARLSAAGFRVAMLGSWTEGLQALQANGVCVAEDGGQEHSYPVQATSRPNDLAGTRYALVLVKSWQTERAAAQLAQCLAPDGLALTLQNGLGNREVLAQKLGTQRTALGITTIGANLLGPGRVRPAGEGVITLEYHARLGPLAEILRAAKFLIENAPDPNVLVWGKLIINAAINPITALLGITNGEILTLREAQQLQAAVAREAASVAVAKGIRLPYPDPVLAVETISRRTASNRSSMLQDIQRGAPTEIDAICGAIVQAGEATGIPTPVNRTLWQLIKALAAKGKKG